ncbi:hypothetical protein PQS90_19015 [Pseudomonas sp. BLCC-B13]|uniref:hypothetical protein n=1 Tax=Pseudomonas sp. BLCC-B13 TaxID=3025314 RepID=UPI00234F85E5|nr:hypothetical protein [Pseudomonas sp. BLCC-B13]MDC7827252.1 hypothetical protein [Pseudomonas sp. BLCC-B13]
MAFDMYHGSEKACIETHEESLFIAVSENPNYPCLGWLSAELYKSPRIAPEKANIIVHELIALRVETLGTELNYATRTIDRIMPFFSKAYLLNAEIKCVSD